MTQYIDSFLEVFEHVLVNYPVVAPVVFVVVRMLPIVIPPIPGLFLDVVGVAVFGWKFGFVLAEIAVMISSMMAFYIARRFREPVVGKFASLQKVHEWEAKLSEKEKFWGFVLLRFVSSPFFDVINYAAGLTKMKASHYFWASFIVSAPMGLMIYYFGDVVLNTPTILVFMLVLVIGLWMFRYARKEKNNEVSGI